ncbi:RNA polymerase sigma factor (sigma-70 family) [Streptomyces sp. V3I8]|uniref:sigma-70 family RNA polymerase sigma factor n=1 Tax=Streptomyces sp. V3I8 TaxID=3042279 RepID=UPI00278AC283|nr:sigma-70 family RNA polymerase sigma factor [Streptomyces sp. V3I8]MDQ1037216.1 RNA polymerase sigma factor (sigma-70 family) [Streptomyces sp. V3I8]
MSVDGRDGASGDGGTETGAETGAETGTEADVEAEAEAEAEAEGSVPAQREWRDSGVLPPPVEPFSAEPPTSDAELVEWMRSGDDTAYEELFRRHSDAVRRYARTCCQDTHTADDLTAEVFARTLQAVRGGSGPRHSVRAYLLTTVRRVAAGWTRSARREHLVDDFAVFAARAARGSDLPDDTAPPGSFGAGHELGADVRAMHEAEQSLAMQAFRSLPERWQAVLWHTEVEDESPSEVATLFGLDANGTRVLASRAREGLKQAYLQAHVSAALALDEECARHADRLGAYARGGLRTRAERGLRKHLEECARCRLAAGQIKEVANGIPAVVPVAVIGWFGAAGYAKAAALIAGGTGVGAAGAAGAASAAGGGAGGAGAGGGAAAEGFGAPVKAGIAAGVVAVAVAAVVFALAGDDIPAKRSGAGPRPPGPVVGPSVPSPSPEPPGAAKAAPGPVVALKRTPTPEPKPSRPVGPAPEPRPASMPEPKPAPTVAPAPGPTPSPAPPAPAPAPPPPPAPAPAPAVFRWNALEYGITGDGTRPEMRLGESTWVWQRYGMSVAGKPYANGVTVHGASSVTIDLNRACSSYDAMAGVDDLTRGLGQVRFSVFADGVRVWRSEVVRGGQAAVPVRVDLTGQRTIRLVVEPRSAFDTVSLADWADSRFRCG